MNGSQVWVLTSIARLSPAICALREQREQVAERHFGVRAGPACSVAFSQLPFSRADNACRQLYAGVLPPPASHPPAPHVAGQAFTPPPHCHYPSSPHHHGKRHAHLHASQVRVCHCLSLTLGRFGAAPIKLPYHMLNIPYVACLGDTKFASCIALYRLRV